MSAELQANLRCYRVECAGEFEPVGENTTDTLFRCRKCGAELSQSATEKLADDDGPVAEIARVLLEAGSGP